MVVIAVVLIVSVFELVLAIGFLLFQLLLCNASNIESQLICLLSKSVFTIGHYTSRPILSCVVLGRPTVVRKQKIGLDVDD